MICNNGTSRSGSLESSQPSTAPAAERATASRRMTTGVELGPPAGFGDDDLDAGRDRGRTVVLNNTTAGAAVPNF